RAVTLCSVDVALDIVKGPLPPEETVATRTYINQCYKLFKIFNNNLEVDPKCYKELLKILLWFDNWYKETKQESSKATSELHMIPKTMCRNDVENYFSLQPARVSGGKPTTLQFF
ncbi:unnamed protein product, partial [Porites lobata]